MGGVEERLPVARQPGLALCLAQRQTQVTADEGFILRRRLREVERPGEVPERVVGGQGGEGGLACLPGVADGLGRIGWLAGTEPVVGQLTHPRPGVSPTAASMASATC